MTRITMPARATRTCRLFIALYISHINFPPGRFSDGTITFLLEDLLLERRGPLAPFPPYFFFLLDEFQPFRFFLLFDPLQDNPARLMPVKPLRALFLTFDLDAGRYMAQNNARRCLVDILPAGSGGAHEHFPEILLINAQLMHPAL